MLEMISMKDAHMNLNAEGYGLDHTAYHSGYVTRKVGEDGSKKCYMEEYDGKFGKGFKLHTPTNNSTFFHVVEYWIKKEGE